MSLRQMQRSLTIATAGRGLTEFTRDVQGVLNESGLEEGLTHLFLRHTSASLLIQENADPEVQIDLERFFQRLCPDGDSIYEHTMEGPDDMPAHVRTALTSVHLSIPFAGGSLLLGTWQGIYLWEHRIHPHQRQVVVHLTGS
ncbi:MAG: secondary thiamine-phosphate synthase enzyme YjbQ [Verrucomicrobiota bacterium]|jgi:secondary thiamine-phosphate synthase enzyme|nr:secondary thiamine-phosphate synthase enzyme YjbQ [Verrucomicrobiota bacterium]